MNEIFNQNNLALILLVVAIIAIARYISKFARNTVPRLLWFGLGIFLILSSFKDSHIILLDTYTLLGIGFVWPHVRFFFEWLYGIYTDLKRATINSYYFVLTVYFKIRRVVLWFYETYQNIKAFFSNRKQKRKEKSQDYYEEEQKQDYGYYEQKSNRQERQKEHKQEYRSYEYESSNNHEEETEDSFDEFARFFSDSFYTVLGIWPDDDFEKIKMNYRALVKLYHPDRHQGDERYTEIMQRINAAYEYFEKLHKK